MSTKTMMESVHRRTDNAHRKRKIIAIELDYLRRGAGVSKRERTNNDGRRMMDAEIHRAIEV